MGEGAVRLRLDGDGTEILASGADPVSRRGTRWLWLAGVAVLVVTVAWQPVVHRLDASAARTLVRVAATAAATLDQVEAAAADVVASTPPDAAGLRASGLAVIAHDYAAALHTVPRRLARMFPRDRALRQLRSRLVSDVRADLAVTASLERAPAVGRWPHRLADETTLEPLITVARRWHVATGWPPVAPLPGLAGVLAHAARYADTPTGLRIVTGGVTGQTLIDVDASRERPIRLLDGPSPDTSQIVTRPSATFLQASDQHVLVLTGNQERVTRLPVRAQWIAPGTRPGSVWILPAPASYAARPVSDEQTRLVEIDAHGRTLHHAALSGSFAVAGRIAVAGHDVRDVLTGHLLGQLPVPASRPNGPQAPSALAGSGGIAPPSSSLAILGIGTDWVAWMSVDPPLTPVHLYDVATGQDRALPTGTDIPAAETSPDGRHLALSTGEAPHNELLLIDGSTGGVTRLTLRTSAADADSFDRVLWAPDSSRIIFARTNIAIGAFDLLYTGVAEREAHWLRHRSSSADWPLMVLPAR